MAAKLISDLCRRNHFTAFSHALASVLPRWFADGLHPHYAKHAHLCRHTYTQPQQNIMRHSDVTRLRCTFTRNLAHTQPHDILLMWTWQNFSVGSWFHHATVASHWNACQILIYLQWWTPQAHSLAHTYICAHSHALFSIYQAYHLWRVSCERKSSCVIHS